MPQFKRPGSGMKYSNSTSASQSAHAPLAPQPAKLFTFHEIKDRMEASGVLEEFENLPPASVMMFHVQKVHENGGEWRLRVGNIIIDGEKRPLWAHMTRPCQVEWRYDVNSVPTLEQRPDFELVRPLCFLYAGNKATKKNTLDTMIAFYFVAAGKWEGMIEGGDQKVSIKAMEVACKLVTRGTASQTVDQPAYIKAIDATSRETLLREECDAKERQLAECLSLARELISISSHYGQLAKDMMNKKMTQKSIETLEATHDEDMEEYEKKKKEFEQRYGNL